jgi:hypothetical protein
MDKVASTVKSFHTAGGDALSAAVSRDEALAVALSKVALEAGS